MPAVAAPRVRRTGLCPTLERPSQQRDGLLVRVPLVGGSLTIAQLELIADLVDLHGNGVIELTNRGNLQLRGFDESSVAMAVAELAAAGLGDAMARVVTISPLAGSREHDVRAEVVGTLAAMDLDGLSGKFVVHVDDGSLRSGRHADVVLTGATGDSVWVNLGHVGTSMSPASAVALVQTIVRQCIAHGPNARWKDVEAARAAGTAGRFGTDGTAAQVSPIVSGHPGAPEPPVGQPQPTVASAPPIGPVRTSSGTSSGTSFVAGIPLGRTSPAQLRDVARICRAHELGEVSVTPWRSIMFVNVEVNTVLLAARIAAAGLVTSAADPSHGVVACIGRAGCWQTELDTLAEAADAIVDRSAGAHQLGSLHVSGCAKSCATTEPVDVLLLGRDDSSGFDIVRAAAERS